jgi:carbamoyl-phosphate synthase small subunit
VKKAILALADGTYFDGIAVGDGEHAVGEVVFNTAMTGYQEILTDPSYAEQIITFTYPHIGNVGTNANDFESNRVQAKGFIIRELPTPGSNWRAEQSFQQFIATHHLLGIAEIDTRALVHHLRLYGAQAGCILVGDDVSAAITLARAWGDMQGRALVSTVATSSNYQWDKGLWPNESTTTKKLQHIVVLDFGVKQGILRHLTARHCLVTVVPPHISAADILLLKPNGIVLSNGPGDPATCTEAIQTVQTLLQHPIPMLGICLGHQLLALALGAKTIKMKQGHHGANHPVQALATEQVFITSQNHGFTVDENYLPETMQITHRSLFDNSIQGFRHRDLPILAFQGHPEANPGPREIAVLFDEFIAMLTSRSGTHA